MSSELNRLRWKCRRGMLELDMILTQFLEKKYTMLSPKQQEQLNRLLDESDPVLYKYLIGAKSPDDKELAEMVKFIRSNDEP